MQTSPGRGDIDSPDICSMMSLQRTSASDAGHSKELAVILSEEDRRFIVIHGKRVFPIFRRITKGMLIVHAECSGTVSQGFKTQVTKVPRIRQIRLANHNRAAC